MPAPPLKITVLGSGTSVGVPTIGCHCAVCTSTDPRDNRLRPSILIGYAGRNVLIDTTPDFRTQALRAKIERLDAVLFTHAHADHVMGLDDVRPFNFRQSGPIPIYASAETMAAIRRSFPVHLRRREEGIQRSAARRAPHRWRALRSVRPGVSADPGSAWQPDDLRLSLRRRRVSHRPQRHSGIFAGSAALAGCPFPRRAALQAAPHAFHRGPVRQDRGKAGAAARLSSRISVTTWRTSAPKAFCRRTSGWPAMAWKSWWRGVA
jgi:ribonuclease BN (tRNA processing enzyme)